MRRGLYNTRKTAMRAYASHRPAYAAMPWHPQVQSQRPSTAPRCSGWTTQRTTCFGRAWQWPTGGAKERSKLSSQLYTTTSLTGQQRPPSCSGPRRSGKQLSALAPLWSCLCHTSDRLGTRSPSTGPSAGQKFVTPISAAFLSLQRLGWRWLPAFRFEGHMGLAY